ncbi:MAG: hypothetical protein B6240_11110 [Desulfobacteraceae bacterium 4572_87]|nr:MAG: hypothetical protein B6240_11110 [Desulfobacteraceae bacterium 4572_87]
MSVSDSKYVFFNVKHRLFSTIAVLLFLLIIPATALSIPKYQNSFVDDGGKTIVIRTPPTRVVSRVPSITEILHEIGAGTAVTAVTYHDVYPAENAAKQIVGGYFSPDLALIASEKPDIIFLSDIHQQVKAHFKGADCQLVELKTKSLADSLKKIRLLGKIFNKEKRHPSFPGLHFFMHRSCRSG